MARAKTSKWQTLKVQQALVEKVIKEEKKRHQLFMKMLDGLLTKKCRIKDTHTGFYSLKDDRMY
jgi:hypothetical protein